jgi:hypothetical protein
MSDVCLALPYYLGYRYEYSICLLSNLANLVLFSLIMECTFDMEGAKFNKLYYDAFMYGCMDAGNTEEIEKFNDD